MIGVHAERVAGDDRVVRWVMPAGSPSARNPAGTARAQRSARLVKLV